MDTDGNMVNPYTKEDFSDEIADVVSLLSYVGGCCGTDPTYIALLKERYADPYQQPSKTGCRKIAVYGPGH